jgi:tetratricopeptide (TPR) repeat protein
VRFRTFVENKDFDRLTDLCRERLDNAHSLEESFRWKKDFSIVKSLQGKYGEAYDLLVSASWEAGQVSTGACAKYHDELGIVLIEFGRHQRALGHFDRAHDLHIAAGNITGAGIVDNNKALALEALGLIREAELAARSAVQTAAGCDAGILRECYATWEKLDAMLRGTIR